MGNKEFNKLLEEHSSNPFLNYTESFKNAQLALHLKKLKPCDRNKYISSLLKPDIKEISIVYEKAIKGKIITISIISVVLLALLFIPALALFFKFVLLSCTLVSLIIYIKEINELRGIKNILINDEDISALIEEHE